MATRIRLALVAAVAAIAVYFGAPLAAPSTAMADGPCNGSTNWDNILHICR